MPAYHITISFHKETIFIFYFVVLQKGLINFNQQLHIFMEYDGQELQIKNNNAYNLNLMYLNSSVFGKSQRRGARARRAPLHPRRAPYGRHWRACSEEFFVVGGRLRAPIGAFRPEKPLEGLFGGTFCSWRAPSGAFQLHYPCKAFAIGGRRTIAKGAFGARGGHCPVSPCLRPCILHVSLK